MPSYHLWISWHCWIGYSASAPVSTLPWRSRALSRCFHTWNTCALSPGCPSSIAPSQTFSRNAIRRLWTSYPDPCPMRLSTPSGRFFLHLFSVLPHKHAPPRQSLPRSRMYCCWSPSSSLRWFSQPSILMGLLLGSSKIVLRRCIHHVQFYLHPHSSLLSPSY